MSARPSNYDDIIDSRDVIAAIEELEDLSADAGNFSEDEQHELDALRALRDEAQGYMGDWQYGETLIRDSYFTEYAQQLAEDIGATNDSAEWPFTHIDWEGAARDLQMDYTAVDFDGVTYWGR